MEAFTPSILSHRVVVNRAKSRGGRGSLDSGHDKEGVVMRAPPASPGLLQASLIGANMIREGAEAPARSERALSKCSSGASVYPLSNLAQT